MLSRVISCRNRDHGAESIEIATYNLVDARYSQPASAKTAPEPASASEHELEALKEQVRLAQAEVVAAKRESHEAGRRLGEQQARAEITPVIERMNASIAEISGLRSEMRCRAEKDVVQLAILIAKRILHRELNVDTQALTALARVVFERLARAETCRVTVHPSFVPAISSALPAGYAGRVTIDPDPNCAIGTLIIRSDEGLLDASVDSQLEEIGRGLTDRLTNSGTAK